MYGKASITMGEWDTVELLRLAVSTVPTLSTAAIVLSCCQGAEACNCITLGKKSWHRTIITQDLYSMSFLLVGVKE